jgi:prepilin-type N-terminal cleavage/methylation domain-containing protein
MSARTLATTARGFTLVELLISMTIMLLVIGTIFSMVDPGRGISKTQPEVSDMQERMRIAADSIEKDLIMAGAGTYSGSIAGALANFFPPILPRRSGAINPDPELTFFDDRISIAYVPDTASQTSVSEAMPQPSSEIKVTQEAGCPVAHPLCGFSVGMRVVIFDDTGSYDIFTITEVQESALHLQHRPPNPDFTKAYTPVEHARIAVVDNHVYWLNAGANQLNHYDGFLEDLPIVDDTVQVRFRYFGDPNPPLAPRPAVGTANCIFDGAGNTTLPVLPSNGSSLVELTPAMLTDGPVCGSAPNRFDADLYRVRKVRVELRVQAGLAELRGKNPTDRTLFVNPGISSGGHQLVPDYSMAFEVAPRNMNLIR